MTNKTNMIQVYATTLTSSNHQERLENLMMASDYQIANYLGDGKNREESPEPSRSDSSINCLELDSNF